MAKTKTRNRPKPKAAVMENKPVFKVGDRVTYYAGEYGNGLLNGKTGTVIYVDGTRWPYTVEFDFVVDVNMAVTDYRARKHGIEPKPFHGWFCRPEHLEAAV